MLQKIKNLIKKMNEAGIPLPLVRINGVPTMTGTMAIISFNTCLIGQIGKISRILDGIDLTQANYLFGICLTAYLGRRMQTNAQSKTISIEKDEN